MKSGQTLIILIIFIAIAVIITTSTAALSYISTQSSSRVEQAQIAYDIAESGMENALMSLIRNPDYRSETLPVGTGRSIITVSGSNPYTLLSVGQVGDFTRKIQVSAQYVLGKLTVISWVETY